MKSKNMLCSLFMNFKKEFMLTVATWLPLCCSYITYNRMP